MDKQKNTIVGLLLVGLCCMSFAWTVEMLFFVNLRADRSGKEIIDVLDDVRDVRLWSNLFYVLGVLCILAGGVRVLKLPVARIDEVE